MIRLARSAVGTWLLRLVLLRAPGALPVARLYESDDVVAFRHPRPSYPVHVVVVVRRPVDDVCAADGPTIAAVLAAVRELVPMLGIAGGYRLITNGGRYQQVRQLHFHLVSE